MNFVATNSKKNAQTVYLFVHFGGLVRRLGYYKESTSFTALVMAVNPIGFSQKVENGICIVFSRKSIFADAKIIGVLTPIFLISTAASKPVCLLTSVISIEIRSIFGFSRIYSMAVGAQSKLATTSKPSCS
jgi:hypothetical protein